MDGCFLGNIIDRWPNQPVRTKKEKMFIYSIFSMRLPLKMFRLHSFISLSLSGAKASDVSGSHNRRWNEKCNYHSSYSRCFFLTPRSVSFFYLTYSPFTLSRSPENFSGILTVTQGYLNLFIVALLLFHCRILVRRSSFHLSLELFTPSDIASSTVLLTF